MGIFEDVLLNTKTAVNSIGKKANRVIDVSKLNLAASDIKGELSVSYNSNEIESIFDALKNSYGSYRKPFKHETLVSELQSKGLKYTTKIISDLFDYSLIGNYDENGKKVHRGGAIMAF